MRSILSADKRVHGRGHPRTRSLGLDGFRWWVTNEFSLIVGTFDQILPKSPFCITYLTLKMDSELAKRYEAHTLGP